MDVAILQRDKPNSLLPYIAPHFQIPTTSGKSVLHEVETSLEKMALKNIEAEKFEELARDNLRGKTNNNMIRNLNQELNTTTKVQRNLATLQTKPSKRSSAAYMDNAAQQHHMPLQKSNQNNMKIVSVGTATARTTACPLGGEDSSAEATSDDVNTPIESGG
eukprot:CAMPEP_0174982380 /NCGR_PEP_ID=MMETSP0004_2-20121128/16468_1 /TAXON_ID=420556 /ORGANISM="Ochromonas sp., Strain CCMP1393" /LENGTH=161 /DNA_ID=CAMNT_0016234339 /DNA_START=96 /DNA_END=578 /DNA_ORIENTATION=-